MQTVSGKWEFCFEAEKVEPLTASSSSLEVDPLLKDLTEKKLIFKKNVATLATELKDVRRRLVLQEQSFAKEAHARKVAEMRAGSMEEEIGRLQMCLQEKDEKLNATLSTTQQYTKELDVLKSQLSITQATADASVVSAKSAQTQCLDLLRDLDEKNSLLEAHEDRVNKLGKQIDLLQKDLKSRELSQRQLREEVLRIEKGIMDVVEIAGAKKDCEFRKILTEVLPKNIENINKHLTAKDEEIARLRDEIRVLSVHWKQQSEELQAQLEQQRRVDQELKKRIMKLEFCLQEARTQMRKFQKMGEKRDKAIKELKDQLAAKQPNCSNCGNRVNFWERQGFKIIASMSMLVLVIFAKR
ncbi:nuclear envelope-associated protein 2-like isoform X1 [Zingiber officinale]|uniref:nuclear envelope-associated protein 2-like isoform X1 n=2 Tax=Zingiber officinale TaxID=94328 RepID=UPI001C4D72F9|nr:nuclear envelope-associated protein 2-like isoform X1 [Zingiber officinale]